MIAAQVGNPNDSTYMSGHAKFQENKNEFIFASEIKAIIQLPFVKSEIELDSFADYILTCSILTKGSLFNEKSFFKNIYSLELGQYGYFDEDKLKLDKNWELDINEEIHDEEYAKKILDQIGLRKKLIGIKNNSIEQIHLV